jgi:hypothetical protein
LRFRRERERVRLFRRLELPFRAGTFPPARLACDRPIAIACFRLFTFLPERPDFRVPRLRSCIACLTFVAAFLPYLATVRTSVQIAS